MRTFDQFAVFDWSGAAGPRQSGIALATVQSSGSPILAPYPQKWSRADARDWIADRANAGTNMLIGLDVSAGFPFVDAHAFFPGWYDSPQSAPELWGLVDTICADDMHMAVQSFLTHPEISRHFRAVGACGDRFPPGQGRLRETELVSRELGLANPYSCLNLVGAAQVGKSSLTAMRMLHQLRGIIPIWPFDPIPASGPMLIEIYTSIAAFAAGRRKGRSKIRSQTDLDAALAALDCPASAPMAHYDDHQTDALITTAWLRIASQNTQLWSPAKLTPKIAATEGWTFGVA
jgi:hypothetical protein